MNMDALVKALSANVGPISVDTTLLEAPLLFPKPEVLRGSHHKFFTPDESLHVMSLELSEAEVNARALANAGMAHWMHDIHAPAYESKQPNSGSCEICKMAERMLARNSKSHLGLQLLTDTHRKMFVNNRRAVEKLMELVDSSSEYINSILVRG